MFSVTPNLSSNLSPYKNSVYVLSWHKTLKQINFSLLGVSNFYPSVPLSHAAGVSNLYPSLFSEPVLEIRARLARTNHQSKGLTEYSV